MLYYYISLSCSLLSSFCLCKYVWVVTELNKTPSRWQHNFMPKLQRDNQFVVDLANFDQLYMDSESKWNYFIVFMMSGGCIILLLNNEL